MDNPSLTKVVFNDVDIWFTKQEDANIFIKDVTFFLSLLNNDYKFFKKNNSSFEAGTVHYTFGREQYHLYLNNQFISFVDIVVSETIPVDDFDVNRLTTLYNNDKMIFYGSEVLFTDLINQIKNKQVTMLDSYVERILLDKFPKQVFIKRINDNYLSKGWTVTCLDQHVFPPVIDIVWFLDVFRPTAKLYFEQQNKLKETSKKAECTVFSISFSSTDSSHK